MVEFRLITGWHFRYRYGKGQPRFSKSYWRPRTEEGTGQVTAFWGFTLGQ